MVYESCNHQGLYKRCTNAVQCCGNPCILSVVGVQTPGGVDKAKGRKADNLRNEVAGLEAAVQAASQEYDRVKSRNTQVLTPCCARTLAAGHNHDDSHSRCIFMHILWMMLLYYLQYLYL